MSAASSTSIAEAAVAAASLSLPTGVMITNDDGPAGQYAPFLLPFTRALRRRFKTADKENKAKQFVCIPSSQQSWVGKGITRFDHIVAHTNWHSDKSQSEREQEIQRLIDETPDEIALWSHVNGSPATVANIGLHLLAPFPVDLVISGPNLGRNTGRSFILSSGTVGAALEATLAGKKAIALSFGFQTRVENHSYEEILDACEVAVDLILLLWNHWPQHIEAFNVNIPLGSGRHPRTFLTHILNDNYGALYARRTVLPGSESICVPQTPIIPPEIPALTPAPAPAPGAEDSKHAPPCYRGAEELWNSSYSPPQTQTEAQTQTYAKKNNIDQTEETSTRNNVVRVPDKQYALKFACDFTIDHSKAPNYFGSDLWALKNNHASISPIAAALVESTIGLPEHTAATTTPASSTSPTNTNTAQQFIALFPRATASGNTHK